MQTDKIYREQLVWDDRTELSQIPFKRLLITINAPGFIAKIPLFIPLFPFVADGGNDRQQCRGVHK